MLRPGEIINDTYRVELLLGRGGTAHVYEVSHLRLPRRFALKVITVEQGRDPEFQQRFRQEAEILASLNHPHLVHVVDWNQLPNQQPYLVMEVLDGEDLAKFLARVGALSRPVALRIVVQIADALELAHEHGIVHRDLKPANIFLCRNGSASMFVKVLDFGIAKSVRSPVPLQTDRRMLMGTPGYMAPEQISHSFGEIEAHTDQWALAAILYEMLAGKPAFYIPGEELVTTLMRILTEEPPPLPTAELQPVIQRALSKDPRARYPCLADFVEATGAAEVTSGSMLAPRTMRISGTVEQTINGTALPEGGQPAQSGERAPSSVKGQQVVGVAPARNRLRRHIGAAALLVIWLLSLLPGVAWLRAHSGSGGESAWAESVDGGASAPDAQQGAEDKAALGQDAGLMAPEPPDAAAAADAADASVPVSPVAVKGHSPHPHHDAAKSRNYTVQVTGLPASHLFQKQLISRCVKETFGSAMRQFVGVKIALSRSGSLCVVSKIPTSYVIQLGQCLSAMPPPVPASATFVIESEQR